MVQVKLPPAPLRRLLIAAALFLVSLLIAYTVFAPRFLTDDDPALMMISGGATLSPHSSPYMLWVNPLLSVPLAGFYRWAPTIPWYQLAMILVRLLSGAVVVDVVLRQGWSWSRSLLLLGYLATMDLSLHVLTQLPVTGALAAQAGVLLWLACVHRGRWGARSLALFLVLITVSLAIRVHSGLLVLTAAAPLILLEVVVPGLRTLRLNRSIHEGRWWVWLGRSLRRPGAPDRGFAALSPSHTAPVPIAFCNLVQPPEGDQERLLPLLCRTLAPLSAAAVLLAGMMATNTPLADARLREFGINDLITAIYEREDVLVICVPQLTPHLVTYLREHRGVETEAREVGAAAPGAPQLFHVFKFNRRPQQTSSGPKERGTPAGGALCVPSPSTGR